MTGKPVPTVAVGTAVRDTARDQIALVSGHTGQCLQLRPLEGGREWDADPQRVEPVSPADLLRAQMQALAAEVDRRREESAQTRALAAMADRDAAEVRTSLRGHTQVLNALRDTQIEQGRALSGMADAVGTLVVGQAEHGRMLADNSQTLAEHGQQLAALTEGQQAILAELRRISGNN